MEGISMPLGAKGCLRGPLEVEEQVGTRVESELRVSGARRPHRAWLESMATSVPGERGNRIRIGCSP